MLQGVTRLLFVVLAEIGRPIFGLINTTLLTIFLSVVFIHFAFTSTFRLIKTPRKGNKKAKIIVKGPSKRRGRFVKASVAFSGILMFTTFSLALWVSFLISDLPPSTELSDRSIEASTKIYDRDGNTMYTIFEDKNRTLVSIDEIPMTVQLATLAAEDHNFYNHAGISLSGMTRAFYLYLTEGKVTGGSTITQQLIKNALLSSEKTIVRKVKEIVLALETERTFTKKQILEMYLNEVGYGGTAYGVAEAAKQYFDKDIQDVTLAEAALLAGLIKAPTQFSPFSGNGASALERKNLILSKMHEYGYIDDQELSAALREHVAITPHEIDIKNPHFVFYVKDKLDQKYGAEALAKAGYSVHTTIDSDVQQMAEQVVQQELDRISHLNVSNASVVVMDVSTGEILAMVGSKNYFDPDHDGQVNVATRERQPGSSIKLVNYAYALSHGMTPATVIDDAPITYHPRGGTPYSPVNYDGGFRGQITLRSALAESRNIPAVKVLSSYGVLNMIQMGRDMGITSWTDPRNYGLSLTLGGGEVKLIDLATAYATVANYGTRPAVKTISSITTSDGEHEFFSECINEDSHFQIATVHASEKKCDGEHVLDARVSYMLTDILKDNRARTPAFGAASALVIPGHPEVAVKTGTSNNLKDNLAVGYNQDYVVAVWVGNNDGSPMSRVASGVTGASPIWNNIMKNLLSESEAKNWEVPQGLVRKHFCGIDEWFLEENQPPETCVKPKDSPKTVQNNIRHL